MVRIGICDDDEVLCHQLEEIIIDADSVHGGDIETEVFFDGKNLCRYMRQGNKFDIIFLDIEMGKMDGISTGHEIRDALKDDDVQIIYISSKDSYAMELFDVRPMNFLIKPLLKEKIESVLSHAYRLMKKNTVMFEYKVNRQNNYVAIEKIQYFEVKNRQIIIHIKNDEPIIFYGKLSEVLEKVQRQRFLQISRSILVNYDAIEGYRLDEVSFSDGKSISIARSKRSEIQDKIIEYSREEV